LRRADAASKALVCCPHTPASPILRHLPNSGEGEEKEEERPGEEWPGEEGERPPAPPPVRIPETPPEGPLIPPPPPRPDRDADQLELEYEPEKP
jgi:hypothetical protein